MHQTVRHSTLTAPFKVRPEVFNLDSSSWSIIVGMLGCVQAKITHYVMSFGVSSFVCLYCSLLKYELCTAAWNFFSSLLCTQVLFPHLSVKLFFLVGDCSVKEVR